MSVCQQVQNQQWKSDNILQSVAHPDPTHLPSLAFASSASLLALSSAACSCSVPARAVLAAASRSCCRNAALKRCRKQAETEDTLAERHRHGQPNAINSRYPGWLVLCTADVTGGNRHRDSRLLLTHAPAVTHRSCARRFSSAAFSCLQATLALRSSSGPAQHSTAQHSTAASAT
jgi:hypothetical protein